MRWALQGEGDWVRYHHVLNRVLLAQLVQHQVPTGPLHLAIDETSGGAGSA